MNRERRLALPVVPVLRVLLSSAGILIQPIHALSDFSGKVTYAKIAPDSSGSPEPSQSRPFPSLQFVSDLRGGQSTPYDPYQQNAYYTHPDPNDDGNYQPPSNYEDGFANYNPSQLPVSSSMDDGSEHLFQESVQEGIDRWKSVQMEQYSHLSAEDEAKPWDASGRSKLMQSVGQGSRALIFLIVMWRDIYLLELADSSMKGGLRAVVRTFLGMLFVGNIAGTVVSITSPSHAANKRLKAILNLDKLVEAVMLFWSLVRLTILPARLVPRETFIVGIMHSVLFLINMQAYTRLNWDDGVAPVKNNPQKERRQGVNSQSQVADQSSSEYQTLGQMDPYGDYPDVYKEASDPTNSYYDQHTLSRGDSPQ